jgi:hypothetical protein
MIRDSFPGINSPRLIPRGRHQWNTHQVSVGHVLGFSGASVEQALCLSGVGGAVGVGGALEPWASSDFVGKSWEILELTAKFWESSAGNSGKMWDFCIIGWHRSRVHQSRPENGIM